MNQPLRLMAVLAHPDDESLGLGGTLARYASEGIEVSLVMATRGEGGWHGDPADNPGPRALGQIRETELRAAAGVLDIHELVFLDQIDGELVRADSSMVITRLVGEIRRIRPDVVVTFGPDGVYGHPDHIAISNLTTAALVCAADSAYAVPDAPQPFRVSKLYHRIWTEGEHAVFRSVVGEVALDVDGTRRTWVEWPDWAVTTRLDTADYWWEVQSAVLCHRSQIGRNAALAGLGPQDLRVLWGTQQFCRVMSSVRIEQHLEADLFAGLRDEDSASAQYDAAYVPLVGD